ncbi:ParB/RepB/Spo0J family partition protein [Dactylosporangium sp. CA-092794]|uniref:ParB/RepB/Spo0J family partition protein n=1 Tax=Dactylosporangium sp. CA-092794 TaxID=3239929 RepID=UPI003D925B28
MASAAAASAGWDDEEPLEDREARAPGTRPATGSIEFARVRPNQLADDPRNPPRRLDDLDDLANVAEYGLFQPILVTTRQNFLKNNPARAEAIGDAPYVILAGHRRKAAAVRYGLAEVPVHIRHDLSANGGDAIVRLLENLSRKALDPIMEALEYQRLRDENGLKVREIADRLHIPSHSVVSKRLQLLGLPTALQEAVADYHLGVTDAEALSKLADGELQMHAWELMSEGRMPVGQAIAEVHRRRLHRAAAETKQRRGTHDPLDSPRNTADTEARASEREAAQNSGAGRFSSCERLAAQRASAEDVTQVIAQYAIRGASYHRDAVRLAHRWLRKAGIGPVGLTDPTAYLAAVEPADVVHVAFVIAVAADEARMRDPRRSWDGRDVAHLRRLEAAGHQTTEWERWRAAEAGGA